jgi:ABC-2 type transport system ATP-binding protein
MEERSIAAEARDLVKEFDGKRAVDGVSLSIPEGSITGILGPNGAGKTTCLRIMLGIIDPSSGSRSLLGHDRPLEVAHLVGYLPEERGLYPAMPAAEALAFIGALRGLPLRESRQRALELLRASSHEDWAKRPIRTLSKGMAQTVQLLGTIIHQPKLIVLDEPFAGLDALNQEKLEQLIRDQAAAGVTVIFSTHVIAHAERLCERVAIIAEGKKAFELPASGPEPLLKALIDGEAGIETLSIERPGLHDAFIAIAGEAAAREMGHVGHSEEAA